jgi:heat shock protein HslJ
MKRALPSVVVAVLVLAVASADSGGGREPVELEGAWQLASGLGAGGGVETVDSHPITLVLSNGQISGRAACNFYGGSVMISGDHFSLSGMGRTAMKCHPANEVMASEEAYVRALEDVDLIHQDGDQLMLLGPSTQLRFGRK